MQLDECLRARITSICFLIPHLRSVILCSCSSGTAGTCVVWHSSPPTHTFSAHSTGSAMCTSWVSALVTTPSCTHTTSLKRYIASQRARWERVHEFSSHTEVRTHPLSRPLCPASFLRQHLSPHSISAFLFNYLSLEFPNSSINFPLSKNKHFLRS